MAVVFEYVGHTVLVAVSLMSISGWEHLVRCDTCVNIGRKRIALDRMDFVLCVLVLGWYVYG